MYIHYIGRETIKTKTWKIQRNQIKTAIIKGSIFAGGD